MKPEGGRETNSNYDIGQRLMKTSSNDDIILKKNL